MKLLRDLLEVRALRDVRETLTERINARLLSSATALKSRSNEDTDSKGCSTETLTDLITTLKVLAKHEYRSALTRDDIGINPNNAKELIGMLNKIPDSCKAEMPKDVTEFIKAVSSLAPSLKKEEHERLADLESHDIAKRRTAERYLAAAASNADRMYTKIAAIAKGQ